MVSSLYHSHFTILFWGIQLSKVTRVLLNKRNQPHVPDFSFVVLWYGQRYTSVCLEGVQKLQTLNYAIA